MNVAITGASGFVGRHLVDWMRRAVPEVAIAGIVRPHGGAQVSMPGVRLVEADLADPAGVQVALGELRPDAIVHLAGQSSPQQSRLDPGGTLRSNVLGIVNLIESAQGLGLRPAILVVGSAEEYGGAATPGLPLSEDTPLRPSSPYAVSKVAQGLLAVECGAPAGMRVVRTRTFHHTGPGRGEAFAESSFARQIAEIEAGLRPPVIHVGNLEAVRDFTDVRDVVRAYWALVQTGPGGQVFNVCSGRGRPIRDLLEMLLGLAEVEVEIRVDPERLRPADVPVLVGDPSRLQAATGWKPEIPLEQTLEDLLSDWRQRVGKGSGAVPS